jgi:Baseplate J-like protein
MIYSCCTEARRTAILNNPTLNGIDYLEVLDHAAPTGSPRQQTLFLHCLKTAPNGLTPANVLITGGERITGITASWIAPTDEPPPLATAAEDAYFQTLVTPANVLVVRTSTAGDFSPYTLQLVNDATAAAADPFTITEALTGFDPQLASVTFSFKVECGPNFDCKPVSPDCPPDLPTPPPINYLAKDYGSFRTILLDRLNQLLPAWQGTSEADIGVAVAELIAYAGDQLSYQQDAVTTEAYIATARSRISLRRHAKLVDYTVHDGCNSRAFVCVTVSAEMFLDQNVTRFYTFAPGMPTPLIGNEQAALDVGVVAFQPMQDANLFPAHNEMNFYTWGDSNCCLPAGATEATLLGAYPDLQIGDVLIFQEMLGPQTGLPADADIRHRCAVRLTAVTTQNVAGQPLVDPLFDTTDIAITSAAQTPQPVTEIQWSTEDALPFPLCISSVVTANGAELPLANVSVAFGNAVLADQGLPMTGMPLPTVPEPSLIQITPVKDRCDPPAPTYLPVRYRPAMPDSPITQAVPIAIAGAPVTSAPVPLLANGFVSLTDANGNTSLAVEADSALSWPQYFGIRATQNTTTPANFDLAIIFDPPGGPAGMPGPVVLELFTDLTLAPSVANNAILQLNSLSRFVSVPSSFAPPASNPTSFPAAPVMLTNTGSISLEDGATTWLELQPANPLSWPPLFGVLAQGLLATPDQFNLLLIFQPSSGNGVQIPLVAEQFDNLSLATVTSAFAAGSTLISVVSFAQGPSPNLSAYDLMNIAAAQALPVITLTGTLNGANTRWTPLPDLLASGPEDPNFVVEIDTDFTAYLRFGDNTNGLRPASETQFSATYRVGNGTAGNVGAGSLIYFEGDPRIQSTTNPLPASGGTDPETNAQIRRRAPQAFLNPPLERAITQADYASVTETYPGIEDAAAMPRWTGSWTTMFIAAEPDNATLLSPTLRRGLTRYVDRYRLAGMDLKLEGPDYVPLQIALTICVDPDYFSANVQKSLLQVLGAGIQPNGQPGLFTPGNFQLGQTVYLSPIYAAARGVAGVDKVTATIFQPQGVNTRHYLHKGEIKLGIFQVAQLDNDPSYSNHGQLTLNMVGGK